MSVWFGGVRRGDGGGEYLFTCGVFVEVNILSNDCNVPVVEMDGESGAKRSTEGNGGKIENRQAGANGREEQGKRGEGKEEERNRINRK